MSTTSKDFSNAIDQQRKVSFVWEMELLIRKIYQYLFDSEKLSDKEFMELDKKFSDSKKHGNNTRHKIIETFISKLKGVMKRRYPNTDPAEFWSLYFASHTIINTVEKNKFLDLTNKIQMDSKTEWRDNQLIDALHTNDNSLLSKLIADFKINNLPPEENVLLTRMVVVQVFSQLKTDHNKIAQIWEIFH